MKMSALFFIIILVLSNNFCVTNSGNKVKQWAISPNSTFDEILRGFNPNHTLYEVYLPNWINAATFKKNPTIKLSHEDVGPLYLRYDRETAIYFPELSVNLKKNITFFDYFALLTVHNAEHRNSNVAYRELLHHTIHHSELPIFVNTTVEEVLYGMDSPVLNLINSDLLKDYVPFTTNGTKIGLIYQEGLTAFDETMFADGKFLTISKHRNELSEESFDFKVTYSSILNYLRIFHNNSQYELDKNITKTDLLLATIVIKKNVSSQVDLKKDDSEISWVPWTLVVVTLIGLLAAAVFFIRKRMKNNPTSVACKGGDGNPRFKVAWPPSFAKKLPKCCHLHCLHCPSLNSL